MTSTQYHTDAKVLADAIIAEVGKDIVLGLPLGLGKANHIANALFARAAVDPSISLKIFTALTLELPRPTTELHRRFIEPVVDRLFGAYPSLAYADAIRDGQLPPNVEVNEFYFTPGRWLGVAEAQQHYISANYTHAARYVLERGVNVVAQLVARQQDDAGNTRYSMSCNADITPDLLEARRSGSADFVLAGEINDELPFMFGDADVPASEFAHILQGPGCQFPLYAPPKLPVTIADYAAGLNVARLVRDGGTLQIGIGSIGDAVAHSLILRHRNGRIFRQIIQRLAADQATIEPFEGEPFEIGLYGCSEMFVDSFLNLIDAGVVKREADGVLLHGSFFLGPKNFYKALREMPQAERARIVMKSVSFVNSLLGQEEEKRRARVKASFVNNAMMATLLGAVISDGLEDGQVVSGVGGQHDFVTQAFGLEDARSIITLNATREHGGKTISNIRWSYGNQTIPRHLRDIVVTEYGVADLRGRTDAVVIQSMLAVADSRFQDDLLHRAKDAGKIPKDYEIPAAHRENTPERIEVALAPARQEGLLPTFPFGTDLTEEEQRLVLALGRVRSASASKWQLARLLLRGLRAGPVSDGDTASLARMGLAAPQSLRDRVYRALVRAALEGVAE